MTRSKKYLSLTVIFSISIAITGCIVNPSAQNQPAANTNSYYNQNSGPVDVSDLLNSDSSHAIQQLRNRGFYQVGARLSKSWWLYSNTIQCIQLDIANGKVIAIGPKSSQDCHSTR